MLSVLLRLFRTVCSWLHRAWLVFFVPSQCGLTDCAKRADHSKKGSVLLTQLFRESAREANQEYYSTVSNKHLKALKSTFTSFVPDNYQQVELVNIADDEAYKAGCPCRIGRQADAMMILGVISASKLQFILFGCLQQASLPCCPYTCTLLPFLLQPIDCIIACHDDSKTRCYKKSAGMTVKRTRKHVVCALLQYLEEYHWKVNTGLSNADLHQAVAPHLEGDQQYASHGASNNGVLVEAFVM